MDQCKFSGTLSIKIHGIFQSNKDHSWRPSCSEEFIYPPPVEENIVEAHYRTRNATGCQKVCSDLDWCVGGVWNRETGECSPKRTLHKFNKAADGFLLTIPKLCKEGRRKISFLFNILFCDLNRSCPIYYTYPEGNNDIFFLTYHALHLDLVQDRPGWYQMEDSDYEYSVLDGFEGPRNAAIDACASHGAHLLHIRNTQHHSNLAALLHQVNTSDSVATGEN